MWTQLKVLLLLLLIPICCYSQKLYLTTHYNDIGIGYFPFENFGIENKVKSDRVSLFGIAVWIIHQDVNILYRTYPDEMMFYIGPGIRALSDIQNGEWISTELQITFTTGLSIFPFPDSRLGIMMEGKYVPFGGIYGNTGFILKIK